MDLHQQHQHHLQQQHLQQQQQQQQPVDVQMQSNRVAPQPVPLSLPMSLPMPMPMPMAVVAHSVASGTSKTSTIKSLLLEAWRGRWSEIEWGIKIKRVLPRGVSGDVYDLADCILSQGLVGPTPNTLFISYLNHCISSRIVSYGAVLSAIAKYEEFNKWQCISTLLDLVVGLKHRIGCYGNEEECLSLCKSIVSLAGWLFCCLSHFLGKLSEIKVTGSAHNQGQFSTHGSSHGHHHHHHHHNPPTGTGPATGATVQPTGQGSEMVQIVEKACDVLKFVASTSFMRALFHVGKIEDGAAYSHLVSKFNEVEQKINSPGTSLALGPLLPNSKDLFETSLTFLVETEWNARNPATVAAEQLQTTFSTKCNLFSSMQYNSVFTSLNAVIAFDAVLNPVSDTNVCAEQILMIAKFNDLSLSDLYCEIIRACFVGLVDSGGSGEDLKWAAFTFLKIPHILSKLQAIKGSSDARGSGSSELEAGLEKLLAYTPLLDLTDSKSNCDCLQLFLNELCKTDLLSEQKVKKIISRRQSESSKHPSISRTDQAQSGQAGASLILRAEPTVTSILKTLDSDYSKNQEALLGVLCHMVPGKSFELILNAAAATGKLRSFTTKLIKFNEFNKQINGESGKASQTRALLFDITFLMLCHIAQNYGTDIITANGETKDSFFATWCAQCLTEGGRYRCPDLILGNCDPNKVDILLNQFTSTDTEFKTSLVKWHEACQNSPAAIKEVLLAWEYGAISTDNVKLILDNVKSRMCCLPVVISAWLCSYINILHHDERLKPMNMLQQFMTPLTSSSEAIPNCPVNPSNGSTTPNSTTPTGTNIVTTPVTTPTTTTPTNSNGNGNGAKDGDQCGANITNPQPSSCQSNADGNVFYKERSTLMATIIKKMLYDLHPPQQNKSKGAISLISHGLTIKTPLWEIIESNFVSAQSRSWLDLKAVHNMDTLLCVGGSPWFVDTLIRQLVKYEHSNDLNRAVGLIFGLFHMDVEECALALLTHVLPNYLLNEHKQELLFEPKASALARLTVMTIYSALNELNNQKGSRPRTGRKRLYQQDVSVDYEPMEVDFKVTNPNVAGNQRPPKTMRRNDSQSGLYALLDDTPFAYQERQQFSSEDPTKKCGPLLNELFTKAIADLLRLLTAIISDSVVSQRILFPLVFLEQLVLCVKDEAQEILQFMPLPMIMNLVKTMPEAITYEFLLAIGNLQTLKSRKVVARALCQLSRAKKGADKSPCSASTH